MNTGPTTDDLIDERADDAYENTIAREAVERAEAPRCRYSKDRTCDCAGRGLCLEIA